MTQLSHGLWAATLLAAAGCVDVDGGPDTNELAFSQDPIVNGTDAIEYPEAAYLNIDRLDGGMYICSGALLSPTVVLTAGHCVDTHWDWEVNVAGVRRHATRAAVYDWDEAGATGVNPLHHDVGLVFLDEPVTLTRYPTLAGAPLEDQGWATCVGRVRDGEISTQLYRRDIQLHLGGDVGYPLDYTSSAIIESGDSGGPVFQYGTHKIIAVNSGIGGDIQVLARTDLLAQWIERRRRGEDARARLFQPVPTAAGGVPTSFRTHDGQQFGSGAQQPAEDCGSSCEQALH